MLRYINMDSALQAHPEFLNEQIDDHDKAIYAKGWNACNSAFYGAIKELPTVSTDEVRGVGMWEDVSVHDNIRNIMIASMRCSVCKRYHNEVYHYGNPTEMARYCPVCGAKMEVTSDA